MYLKVLFVREYAATFLAFVTHFIGAPVALTYGLAIGVLDVALNKVPL
jgi:hypothetical protein